jgi:hypothetical protein
MSAGRRPGSNRRPSSKKKASKRSASNPWLIPLIGVPVLAIVGLGVWFVTSRQTPSGVPHVGSQLPVVGSQSPHVAKLEAMFAARIARLEAQASITDVASVSSKLPALKNALEAEIAATDAWRTYMEANPADEATRQAMVDRQNEHIKKRFDVQTAVAKQYLNPQLIQAIETPDVASVFLRLKASEEACPPLSHQPLVGSPSQNSLGPVVSAPQGQMPRGVNSPNPAKNGEHLSKINAYLAARRSQCDIQKTITNGASAASALPAYRNALEAVIAAEDAWYSFLTANPPDEATRKQLLDLFIQDSQKVKEIMDAINKSSIGRSMAEEAAINNQLMPLQSLFERKSQLSVRSRAALQILEGDKRGTAPPINTTDANTGSNPSANPPSTALPDKPPEWVDPPQSQFVMEHGRNAVFIRVVGLDGDINGKLGALVERFSRAIKASSTSGTFMSTATAHFVAVSPVSDLDQFAKEIESAGKVLQVNNEKRGITIWISPEVQKDRFALRGFSPQSAPQLPGFPQGFSQPPPAIKKLPDGSR